MQVDDASLSNFLIDSGLLSRRQLDEVEQSDTSLYETLARSGVLSQDELRRAIAGASGIPFVVLDTGDAELEALVLIPEPIARTYNVVAFATKDSSVEVAMLDLDALDALQFLQTERGLRILPRLTTADSIKRALLSYHKHLKEKFGEHIKGSNAQAAADALLAHALLHRASSVHLETRVFLSGQHEILARYRINGILYDAMTLPREAASITSRLKELAGLSHTLHVSQEGSFKIKNDTGEEVRVRVCVLPTMSGERVVLYLTKSTGSTVRKGFTLESLGFHGETLEQLHRMLAERSGLILVSGVTGSDTSDGAGKTTLLYTMLDLLVSPERALASVEEGVALSLPHVAQTPLRQGVGLTMEAALRATLKQDPDVVMIDTLRTGESLALAATAAKRGMLVVAGVSGFEFEAPEATAIRTHVVGRACQKCKEAYKLSRAEAAPFEAAGANFGKVLAALKEEGVIAQDAQWKDLTFARPQSCGDCDGGYKGLTGVQEVSIKGEGVGLNILEDGLFKAAAGLTTIDEVAAILSA